MEHRLRIERDAGLHYAALTYARLQENRHSIINLGSNINFVGHNRRWDPVLTSLKDYFQSLFFSCKRFRVDQKISAVFA
jgi:hypothetical protein